MPIVFEGKANVFEVSGVQTVVCTVNLVGVMGAGVAKEYRRRYPEAYHSYRSACRRGFSIGQLLLQRLNDGRLGLCFPTKQHWRNPSELPWIELGLEHLVKTYKSRGITSLAITPLGCANGQLNYQKDVRPLMHYWLNQMDIPVHICI